MVSPSLWFRPVEPGGVVLNTVVVSELVLQHLATGDAGDGIFPAPQPAVVGRVYILLPAARDDVMHDHVAACDGAFVQGPGLVRTTVSTTFLAVGAALGLPALHR